MDEKYQFDWVDFYEELTVKLLPYKDNRTELISKVREIYTKTGINMPTLDKDNQLTDIDPFTFFGLFNKKLREENRIKILEAIAELFDMKSTVPSSFDSLPVLNPQNSMFYRFSDERGEHDIDDLWELFTSALAYAEAPTDEHKEAVSHYFDLVIQQKGNGNSKITMGLYWISPSTFMNLDVRNEWYIYESGKIPKEVVKKLPKIEPKISSSKYFLITEELRNYLESSRSDPKDFKELSADAWECSKENNVDDNVDGDVDITRYWIYSSGKNSCMWDEFYDAGIMAIGWGEIGDLSTFKTKDDMKEKMRETYHTNLSYTMTSHATWQFANEMQVGDVIFVKHGLHKVIGHGIVTSEYEFDEDRTDEFKHVRRVNWTHRGEWDHPGQAVGKTLTEITNYTEYVKKLKALFEDESEQDIEEPEKSYPTYTKKDFLSEVFMSEEDYDQLTSVLRFKKNMILQGAPGVGKTFAAKRLAYSIMGEKDVERVMMVQFHQSYSYEDFIMGYRPVGDGFELRRGAFYHFCKKAEIDEDNDYFFIIDEINRGNLSKVFGELLMLVEVDKRGVPLQLLYSDEKFAVPKNVHLIGMMNTADRSLAMMDYALRRRFAFFEMKPGFSTDGFKAYQSELENEKFDSLIRCVEELNKVIESDESLGDGFRIGHSYFCRLTPEIVDERALSGIVEYEIIPLLKEYWFDEPEKVREWSDKLRRAIR